MEAHRSSLVAPVDEVAIAHDYLTQRGGAERVVLALQAAFPDAPINTTVHHQEGTFPSFADSQVVTSGLQRMGPLRRNPRYALPLLAAATSSLHVRAKVTVCSTSGWAHGVNAAGAKVLYVHNTARWLYQREEYLAGMSASSRYGLAPLARTLRRWDKRAASSADVVLVNSAVTQARVREHWNREAEILRPPPGLSVDGPEQAVEGLEPGYLLTVARLLPYKRVDAVLGAVANLPNTRLVVVGAGPDRARLEAQAPAGTRFLGEVDDATLRWLYAHAEALVTAAHDDFGLTPLEAMQFGTPVVAVREGGYLETVVEGESGVFFDEATPEAVRQGIVDLRTQTWNRPTMMARASLFSTEAFNERIRAVVADAAERAGTPLAVDPIERRFEATRDGAPLEAFQAGSGLR
jgi:glycosyltransferase involved in cell wall biosynthesis